MGPHHCWREFRPARDSPAHAAPSNDTEYRQVTRATRPIADVLRDAARAVEEAGLPEDLRSAGFLIAGALAAGATSMPFRMGEGEDVSDQSVHQRAGSARDASSRL